MGGRRGAIEHAFCGIVRTWVTYGWTHPVGVWPCAVEYGLALPSPMAPALPAACLTLSKVAMWVPIVGLGAVAWQVATAAARVCDSDAALPTSREDRRLRC